MKFVETGRSDLLELRGGGGGLILAELPFFAIGILISLWSAGAFFFQKMVCRSL
jgi:hypothetical protein